MIPNFHRRLIRRHDVRADRLVKMYLSMFSVSKLILVPKQSNYQFSSIVDDPSTDVESVLEKYGILVKDPFLRYVQELPSIPMVLNWRPFWSSSPVKGDKALVGRTPFHRMIWELFAIALWDRAVLKGLNPKDPDRAAKQAWPFEGWFLYWSSIFILPLFSEFFLPKTSLRGRK